MSNRKYFGTDGIRGRVGDAPITPDFVLKLGWGGPFRTLHWPDANTGRGLSDAYLPRRGRNCDICIA